jgi:hypothetical protein
LAIACCEPGHISLSSPRSKIDAEKFLFYFIASKLQLKIAGLFVT